MNNRSTARAAGALVLTASALFSLTACDRNRDANSSNPANSSGTTTPSTPMTSPSPASSASGG